MENFDFENVKNNFDLTFITSFIAGMAIMLCTIIITLTIAVDYNEKIEAQQSYRGLYEDVVREDSLTILEALGLWH